MSTIICFNCNGRGHRSIDCPSVPTSNRCSHCGRAVNKSLACFHCITSSNGKRNPEIIVAPSNRVEIDEENAIVIEDSDESSDPSPSKRLRLSPGCRSGSHSTSSVDSGIAKNYKPGPASRKGHAQGRFGQELIKTIKVEPTDETDCQAEKSLPKHSVPKPAPADDSSQPPSSDGIYNVTLSPMDRNAIRSTILRGCESWPTGGREYRMELEFRMNNGPVHGIIRVRVYPDNET